MRLRMQKRKNLEIAFARKTEMTKNVLKTLRLLSWKEGRKFHFY